MRARPSLLAVALLALAVLASLVLLAINLATYDVVCDDAYISFRYLDHWLGGHGLVYNAGERVEGYTNFLWIVALAPPRLLGFTPESAAAFLSLAALGLLLWAVHRSAASLARSSAAGWAATVLAAGSISLAYWARTGMETVLFASLLALANMSLIVGRRHGVASSTFFGLATLTRPPGVLHLACAFLAGATPSREIPWRRRVRALAIPAGVVIAILGAHLAFRLVYYGSPLPNTFYAKMTGQPTTLVPEGLEYASGWMLAGGLVLGVAALLVALTRSARNWLGITLVAQVLAHLAFVIWVGGDYFPFGRFLAPIVPALAVLGGVGLHAVSARFPRPQRVLAAILLCCTAGQFGLARLSAYGLAHEQIAENFRERTAVAAWLTRTFPSRTTLAVNAAGLVPYVTGFPTIDMLGLNDAHIARAPVESTRGGEVFVGHFKHDGRYVFDREPDVVLTGGATLHAGRSAREATMQAALNTFPGDRAFLAVPGCQRRYRAVAEELAPGKFVVAYVRQGAGGQDVAGPAPTTGQGWFERGLEHMRWARLQEAITAFRTSLRLNPGNPVALTNLGFCLNDLARYDEAAPHFAEALEQNAAYHDALFGLATAEEGRGNRERAVALWRRYLAQAPESRWKEKARRRLEKLAGERRQ